MPKPIHAKTNIIVIILAIISASEYTSYTILTPLGVFGVPSPLSHVNNTP